MAAEVEVADAEVAAEVDEVEVADAEVAAEVADAEVAVEGAEVEVAEVEVAEVEVAEVEVVVVQGPSTPSSGDIGIGGLGVDRCPTVRTAVFRGGVGPGGRLLPGGHLLRARAAASLSTTAAIGVVPRWATGRSTACSRKTAQVAAGTRWAGPTTRRTPPPL